MSLQAKARVAELIFGQWKSRVLHAGVRLGLVEALSPGGARTADEIARELRLDPALSYRLLRALANIGLMTERDPRTFMLTEEGRHLLADHPQSLRPVALLQGGAEHMAIWNHLPEMIRDGRQDGFVREFGHTAFEHMEQNAGYAAMFHAAMNSYSASQTEPVIEALRGFDFDSVKLVCDIGGGYGYLLCGLLQEHPHLGGIVLERPGILEASDLLEAHRFGLADRCRYIAGDMFEEVPAADLYLLKLILHDWSDADCVRILSATRRSARPGARIVIIEHVVPGPATPHFAKLYDIHMMCWGPGRERSAEEYAALLAQSGWRYAGTRPATSSLLGIIEAVAA
jgi:hypothetical protein